MMLFSEFIRHVWGEEVEGFLELRSISRGGSVLRDFIPAGELSKADEIVSLRPHRNLYFGVCPRAKKEGTLDAVKWVHTLWVDIDYKDTPKEEVKKRAEQFPLQPAFVVLSGGGVHLYFPLKEPYEIREDVDRHFVRELLRALARYWGGDIASTDLARILRVPGSVNYKYEPPRQVKLIEKDREAKYNISDFEFLGVSLEKVKEELEKEKKAHTVWSEQRKYPEQVVDVLLQKCEFFKHCVEDAKVLPEPHWWAMITNLAAVERGEEYIHKFSSPYPRYSERETNFKIEHALDNLKKGIGPHTCEYISTLFECPSGCPLQNLGATPVSAAAAYLRGAVGAFWGSEEREAEVIYVSSILKGKRKPDRTLLKDFLKVVEVLEAKGKEEAEKTFYELLSEEEKGTAKAYHDFVETEEAVQRLRAARLRYILWRRLTALSEEVKKDKDIAKLLDRAADEILEVEEDMDFWRGEVNQRRLPVSLAELKVFKIAPKKEIRETFAEGNFTASVLFSRVFPRGWLLSLLPENRNALPSKVYVFSGWRGGEGRFWALLRSLRGENIFVILVFSYAEDRKEIQSTVARVLEYADVVGVYIVGRCEDELIESLKQIGGDA